MWWWCHRNGREIETESGSKYILGTPKGGDPEEEQRKKRQQQQEARQRAHNSSQAAKQDVTDEPKEPSVDELWARRLKELLSGEDVYTSMGGSRDDTTAAIDGSVHGDERTAIVARYIPPMYTAHFVFAVWDRLGSGGPCVEQWGTVC